MSILKEMTQEMKTTFIETCKVLTGHQKRLFMARVVNSLGRGGMTFACRELGWTEQTVRKGQHELRTGIECLDAVHFRGRKKIEERLPNLPADMKAIVDSQSQIDGSFQTERLYTRLSAAEVRRQLTEQKGYSTDELPTAKTLGVKLNELGYHLRNVTKSKPQKKLRKRTQSSSD
jgi:hypothetical protein